jgi:hypothetical protein
MYRGLPTRQANSIPLKRLEYGYDEHWLLSEYEEATIGSDASERIDFAASDSETSADGLSEQGSDAHSKDTGSTAEEEAEYQSEFDYRDAGADRAHGCPQLCDADEFTLRCARCAARYEGVLEMQRSEERKQLQLEHGYDEASLLIDDEGTTVDSDASEPFRPRDKRSGDKRGRSERGGQGRAHEGGRIDRR